MELYLFLNQRSENIYIEERKDYSISWDSGTFLGIVLRLNLRFPGVKSGKESAPLIPGLGRSPEVGNVNLFAGRL